LQAGRASFGGQGRQGRQGGQGGVWIAI
jgi:hypothetical protein